MKPEKTKKERRDEMIIALFHKNIERYKYRRDQLYEDIAQKMLISKVTVWRVIKKAGLTTTTRRREL